MVVCADADLERAASGAVYGAFANAGQICVSTERVYVVDAVADEFVRNVVEKTSELRQGADGVADVGPMIQEAQLEKVEAQVADAVARGARILAGGRRNPDHAGLYFEPTVLVDVTHDMAVMRDETFGPVLPIMRVRDEEEALQRANDTRYGLSANIWTRDKRKGMELGKRIETGSIVVNDCMLTYGTAEAPFGGRRESGIGQVNGEVGLRSYSHAQSIMVDRFGGKTESLWFPYTARKARLLRRMMRFLWGTPLGRFLS
jgi:succinate-semialdehyde dehydrogenase/glutarate-semialdehyde dehydrogenase